MRPTLKTHMTDFLAPPDFGLKLYAIPFVRPVFKSKNLLPESVPVKISRL